MNRYVIIWQQTKACVKPSIHIYLSLDLSRGQFYLEAGMVVLAPKWVRLAPNGTNPGAFSDQISVHLAQERKML